jgi:hypothetical protein
MGPLGRTKNPYDTTNLQNLTYTTPGGLGRNNFLEVKDRGENQGFYLAKISTFADLSSWGKILKKGTWLMIRVT